MSTQAASNDAGTATEDDEDSSTGDSSTQSTDDKSTNSATRESGTPSANSITSSSHSNLGLILGIVGALAVVGAILGFVLWRRNQAEDDEDDDNSSFNSAMGQGAAFASAPAPATVPLPLPMPDTVPDIVPFAKTTYASQNYIYQGNATVPPVESSSYPIAAIDYDSPSAIDASRRTDSILGGSGVSHISFADSVSEWDGEQSQVSNPRVHSTISVEF